MHITLYLTKEGQIKLFLETDPYQPNPEWALKWVGKNMSFVYDRPGMGFYAIDGAITVESKQISSFLETLIQQGQDNQISTKSADQSLYCSSFAIESVEQAKSLYLHVQVLLLNSSITNEDFNELKKQIDILKISSNLSSVEKFINEYNLCLKQDVRFFGKNFNKINFRNIFNKVDGSSFNLNEVVKIAINDPHSPCRTVFVNLEWMTSDGFLTEKAPPDVLSAYSADEQRTDSDPIPQ